MIQKITFASFHSSCIAPGVLDGGTTLSDQKQYGIEMYTGIESGVLTIFHKGRSVRVPYGNIASMVDEDNKAITLKVLEQCKAKTELSTKNKLSA